MRFFRVICDFCGAQGDSPSALDWWRVTDSTGDPLDICRYQIVQGLPT